MPLTPSKLRALLRGLLKDIRNRMLYWSGAYAWASKRLARQGAIIAINVHRILPNDMYSRTNSPGGMLLKEQTFWKMCNFIQKELRFAHPAELDVRKTSRHPAILLTLDDGWKDNVTPLSELSRMGIASLVFICPQKVGQTNPYWPEVGNALWRAARGQSGPRGSEFGDRERPRRHGATRHSSDAFIAKLKRMDRTQRERMLASLNKQFTPVLFASDSTMTWDDVQTLQKLGVEFGSHGMTHELLPSLPDRELQAEVESSRTLIAEILGDCSRLAYPNGDCDERVRAQVSRAGYKQAFINSPGPVTKDTDRLAIPRINLNEQKVCGPSGEFSRYAFLHATVWACYRVQRSAGVIVPKLEIGSPVGGGW